jgi:5-formyltetrahydrofolate cyclo-ligase
MPGALFEAMPRRAVAGVRGHFQAAPATGLVDKSELRAAIRGDLAMLRPLVRAQQEELVNAAVVSDLSWRGAGTVLVYHAVGHELSVVSAVNDAMRRGIRVCFPRVESGNTLSLRTVGGWTQLEPDALGIPAPAADAPLVTPMEIDVALVPGIAFTGAGARLGQGGGYYDRLLPGLGGLSVGVGFDCQIRDSLPMEAHDRPVDEVWWPGRLLAES